LFLLYAKRYGYKKANVLAEWCRCHSSNCYVPFDSSTSNAITYTQRVLEIETHKVNEAERHVADKRTKLRARKHRERKALAHKERKRSNDEARQAYLEQFSSLTPLEKLKELTHSEHPLEFFGLTPKNGIINHLIDLEDATKAALIKKIDRRRKGVFGKIYRLLNPDCPDGLLN
jgi:hypothetical protein